MADHNQSLLRAILNVTARQAFPPQRLAEIVMKGGGTKQLNAYNLCDGTKGQSEIAKSLKLDTGNFSKTIARWIDAGIVHRIGEGREARLLHVYRLTNDLLKNGKTK